MKKIQIVCAIIKIEGGKHATKPVYVSFMGKKCVRHKLVLTESYKLIKNIINIFKGQYPAPIKPSFVRCCKVLK